MRAIQTKNLTITTRNSRKVLFCYGIEEHQNHNLTGRRRRSWDTQSIYTHTKKLKLWDDEIKLIVQEKKI
jgi:hypothetical protein